MALRRTYYISIDRQTDWSTTDDAIAAAQAKSIAQQYGGCEMIAINEAGGGHVTVYGPPGRGQGDQASDGGRQMGWTLFSIGSLGAIALLAAVLIRIILGAARERRQKAKAAAYMAAWEDWGTMTDLRRVS